MGSPFMSAVASGLAATGVRVIRFELPYMQRRRRDGVRRPPDREAVLVASWVEVIDRLGGGPQLVIGGKSMGGRIASLVADEAQARGLVCFGYPFHPRRRPDRLRTEHLRALTTPTLIVQGARDALGSQAEVQGYELAPSIQLHWLPDADHSFRPRKRSGWTEADHLQAAVEVAAQFVRSVTLGP
jgi:hypothetical protein